MFYYGTLISYVERGNSYPNLSFNRTQFGKRDQDKGIMTSVVSETTMASTISKKSTSSYAEKVQVFTKESEYSEQDTTPLVRPKPSSCSSRDSWVS